MLIFDGCATPKAIGAFLRMNECGLMLTFFSGQLWRVSANGMIEGSGHILDYP